MQKVGSQNVERRVDESTEGEQSADDKESDEKSNNEDEEKTKGDENDTDAEDEKQETERLKKLWANEFFRNEPFVVGEEDGSPVLSAEEDVSYFN